MATPVSNPPPPVSNPPPPPPVSNPPPPVSNPPPPPPVSNPPSPVIPLSNGDELQKKLASAEKLVVLEFVKQDSQICKYVRPERNRIAKEMKEKAEFYELDVDTFKKYAEEFKVEALPAFLVMQKFVKKRHVVGTDDLKAAIEGAHAPNEPAQNSTPVVDASDHKDDDSFEQEPDSEEEEQSTVRDDSDWYYDYEQKNNRCSIL